MIPVVASFDCETTGVDVETCRIVTAAVVVLDPAGQVLAAREWLINPGVPIPAEATAVHGITDERAAEGRDPVTAIEDIIACLEWVLDRGAALVAYNAPFDLTLLDREARRHLDWDGSTVSTSLVLDPLVLDKGIDKWRRGSRKLVDVAAHYGVEFDGQAHGAPADATAAGRLAQVMLTRPELANYGPAAIHQAQIDWAQAQADSFAAYLRKQGKDADDVTGAWPIREWVEQ